MATAKQSGVYKITHTTTGHFYIGSSINCRKRFQAHLSRMKFNKHPAPKFNELYRLFGEQGFQMEILEECSPFELMQREEKYLQVYAGVHPQCVNARVKPGNSLLGLNRTQASGNVKRAKSMLGKNVKHQAYQRPESVDIVGPDGTVYQGVRNISGFAREHGLNQPALNNVCRGRGNHFKGWHLFGADKSKFRYYKGRKQEVVFVSPDGREFLTDAPYKFAESVGISRFACKKMLDSRTATTTSSRLVGDGKGRVWHVKGKIPSYDLQNTKTGEIVKGITAPAQFARSRGIRKDSMWRLICGKTNKTHEGWTIRARAA